MKTFDAAKLRDMVEPIAVNTMLAAMATLCIDFIQRYMAMCIWYYYIITIRPFVYWAYTIKRIANRNVHDRKFALFQRCGGQGILYVLVTVASYNTVSPPQRQDILMR